MLHIFIWEILSGFYYSLVLFHGSSAFPREYLEGTYRYNKYASSLIHNYYSRVYKFSKNLEKVSEVHPCTGTEALYRPYGL